MVDDAIDAGFGVGVSRLCTKINNSPVVKHRSRHGVKETTNVPSSTSVTYRTCTSNNNNHNDHDVVL